MIAIIREPLRSLVRLRTGAGFAAAHARAESFAQYDSILGVFQMSTVVERSGDYGYGSVRTRISWAAILAGAAVAMAI